jgi:NADPH:quinone reductase
VAAHISGTVLVHGGGSGIGTSAIKLCRQAGLRTIVTCGSDDRCQKCIELGADHAINYRTQDFVAEVARHTDHVRALWLLLDLNA